MASGETLIRHRES